MSVAKRWQVFSSVVDPDPQDSVPETFYRIRIVMFVFQIPELL
jgi:hypothetical protein